MKFIKYGIIAIALFFVTALGFFFYSIYKLPDPIVIKQKLKLEKPKEAIPQNEIQEEIAKETQSLSDSLAESSSDPADTTIADQQKSDDIIVSRIMKEDYQDIRVCENLNHSKNQKLSQEMMKKAIEGSDRDDPVIETMRLPLKHVFQSRPIKELFYEIEDLDNLHGEERTSYLKKIGFYAKAALKVQEAYSQKSEFEEVADRSYHLYVISQIASQKPELVHDKNLMDFCNQLETSIATKMKTNIDEERKEVLKLIDYAGMTPQQLGFNPNIKTKFHVNITKKGFAFGFENPGMEAIQ